MNLKAMHRISYGLYIVASKRGESLNGQAANALIQVSSDPVTIVAGLNKQNLTHEYIAQEGRLSVSILEQDTPISLIGHFGFRSGRDTDKFSGVNFGLTGSGLPYLTDHTLAYLEAVVIGTMDAGTHTLFWCKVTDAQVLKEGVPMTYAYYQQVKKGSTPHTAPTFIPKDQQKHTDRYVCKVCGYIYDPEKGDPDGNIPPGTPFQDLPAHWVCPVCGASKGDFEKEE